MDSSVSSKDEIWFLCVCHHISTGLYIFFLVYLTMVLLWHWSSFVTRTHEQTNKCPPNTRAAYYKPNCYYMFRLVLCHPQVEDCIKRKCMNTYVQKCWEVLSPTRLKKQLKGRHSSSDAEVMAAAGTWLDGQTSEFFFEWLAKLEFGRCS